MNWEQLKGQLEDAVKQEAVKVLDEAIARLQQLRAHYMDGSAPGEAASPPPVKKVIENPPAYKAHRRHRVTARSVASNSCPRITCRRHARSTAQPSRTKESKESALMQVWLKKKKNGSATATA